MSVDDLSRVDDVPVTSIDDDDPAHSQDGPTRSPGFRLVLLVVLLMIALGGLGALAWLLTTRSVDAVGIQGEQDQVQSQREAVMVQSEQFVLRFATYGPDLLDDKGAMPTYRTRVKEVITAKFAVSFDQQAGTAEKLVAEAGISRAADVFATGVSTIDADSATALVAGAFTDTYPKVGQREPTPFRYEVNLVEIDGKWLVDDFTPVTGTDQ